ncbi:hypothetical protein NX868_30070 [Burkholderia thailandensis]|uniref:Uncharacterized protein n=1 Tax=Burkholderia thailandensis TaxID=57975 RepID=A0AAW9CRF7_BURTH|nr:hypothetical protein [Burkholderia thailandensis]MCS3394323.1 hypothetical protein [Burkholderia thailandensis]MCS6429092.1 hypothetical protein [Burkholderia thailandensis]MCS6456797.1 hypothetical protein [Burkholderia thailandensis]MCS6468118.1 hypothetical protein [Burkholderia thailandensis]MCS6486516.1 hypothetical protein [Burkholderia thailandensis]
MSIVVSTYVPLFLRNRSSSCLLSLLLLLLLLLSLLLLPLFRFAAHAVFALAAFGVAAAIDRVPHV